MIIDNNLSKMKNKIFPMFYEEAIYRNSSEKFSNTVYDGLGAKRVNYCGMSDT